MNTPPAPTLAELLSEIDSPATKDDLLLLARRGRSDQESVQLLEKLPNRSFSGCWDVRGAAAGPRPLSN